MRFTPVLAALLGQAAYVAAQGNDSAPFPDSTYPDAVSPNPETAAGSQSGQASPPKYPSPWSTGAGDWDAAYKRAKAVIRQMTLEEKVNITTGVGWENEACVGNTGAIPRLGIPSLCFQDSPTAIRNSDFNSAFPAGVNVAAAWDKSLAWLRGEAMGKEFNGKGIDGLLGPVAGPLGRAPEGGRNWEGFSPDPYLTGVLFAETIKGIQSTGQMAVGKHYILNEQEHFRQVPETRGFDLGNITYPGSSNVDEATLHELYLWPFADAVRAGLVGIMCSYQTSNSSATCQNSYLLNHILKGELGFQGFVQSDWQAQYTGVASILAGMDMTMPGDTVFNSGVSYQGPNLTIGVLNGSIPLFRINDMATRVLAAWYYVEGDSPDHSTPLNFQAWSLDTYGPFHKPAGAEYGYGLINQHVDVRGEHGNFIRELGAASTVLLKNTDNTLPLTGLEKLTTVFGEDAGGNPWGPNGCSNRACNLGTLAIGWGSGTGNFPYLITPDEAIKREVTDRLGAYESITHNGALAQIQALAKRAAEVGGVCLAFANADAGEGFVAPGDNWGDRNNLTSWNGAEEVLNNVTANCNNTILVFHSVGQIDISRWKDHENVTAIVWAGLPGEQSGNSLVDILYGRVNPSAKLPYTIGANRSDYGTDVLYVPNDEDTPQMDFTEGVFIDYRSFDLRGIKPTYEFGFGLSYTSFEYSDLKVSKLDADEYKPATGMTPPAPTYGNITNGSSHLFPANFTRVPLYIYPWLNTTDLEAAYGWTDYGDDSFIPEDAHDSSPQPILPAGGAPGGNPQLWDVLFTVNVTVTNTGEVAGEEVAQLYLSLGGEYDPVVVLRGFEKVLIQPGESVQVGFELLRRDLSNWDTASQNWVITESEKTVHVGSSSRNLPLKQALELGNTPKPY